MAFQVLHVYGDRVPCMDCDEEAVAAYRVIEDKESGDATWITFCALCWKKWIETLKAGERNPEYTREWPVPAPGEFLPSANLKNIFACL